MRLGNTALLSLKTEDLHSPERARHGARTPERLFMRLRNLQVHAAAARMLTFTRTRTRVRAVKGSAGSR